MFVFLTYFLLRNEPALIKRARVMSWRTVALSLLFVINLVGCILVWSTNRQIPIFSIDNSSSMSTSAFNSFLLSNRAHDCVTSLMTALPALVIFSHLTGKAAIWSMSYGLFHSLAPLCIYSLALLNRMTSVTSSVRINFTGRLVMLITSGLTLIFYPYDKRPRFKIKEMVVILIVLMIMFAGCALFWSIIPQAASHLSMPLEERADIGTLAINININQSEMPEEYIFSIGCLFTGIVFVFAVGEFLETELICCLLIGHYLHVVKYSLEAADMTTDQSHSAANYGNQSAKIAAGSLCFVSMLIMTFYMIHQSWKDHEERMPLVDDSGYVLLTPSHSFPSPDGKELLSNASNVSTPSSSSSSVTILRTAPSSPLLPPSVNSSPSSSLFMSEYYSVSPSGPASVSSSALYSISSYPTK
eukprot:TRINITY_DN4168_c0_g1_i1.p1 TRINITY_DN4168_c0_g1~~TRINITY_DN4168_c0_g1_i1.p1  ORF type:complete len:415 (-),score=57.58 TRINITY_DN4168_c0_g1_i1:19-1263(-)